MQTHGETWLRVVTYKVDAGDERAQTYLDSNLHDVLHILERQPGFQLGYWGRDVDAGTMAAVTYWSSRDAIDDAGYTLHQLQAEAASHGVHRMGVRIVRLLAVPPA